MGIDRVLAEADAAKASLDQHFGGKDQLVASSLERRTVAARAHIEAYLASLRWPAAYLGNRLAISV